MKGPAIDWAGLSPLLAVFGGGVVVLMAGLLRSRFVRESLVPLLAAATLGAFAPELASAGIDPIDLAASLGCDVPFFLDGPVALATGRGEVLSPLPGPARDVWVVLAMPDFEIPEKTRTMYSAIDPAWWSDGCRVRRIAENLPTMPTSAPFNVFDRALLRIHPELESWRRGLREAGFPFVALSGAGPTHYTLALSQEQARDIQAQLSSIGVQAITACLLSRWEGADDQ